MGTRGRWTMGATSASIVVALVWTTACGSDDGGGGAKAGTGGQAGADGGTGSSNIGGGGVGGAGTGGTGGTGGTPAKCTQSPPSCSAGQYCDPATGCVANPACADVSQCQTAWASDACKTNITCDAATATCAFEILDKDADGSAPVICGGTDCDDTDATKFGGNVETCNGKDDDCDGASDEQCSCPTGQTLCGALCADTKTDPKNCGTCSNDCGIGACAAGSCGPKTLTSGLGMRGLAVDASGIYFGQGNRLHRCELTSCNNPPDQLVDILLADQIALAADYVYFSSATGFELHRVSKTGGTKIKVNAVGYIRSLASAGGDPCYGTSYDIYCGPSATLAVDSATVTDLAMDQTALYWTDYVPFVLPGYGIRSCTSSNCTQPKLIAPTTTTALGSIAVDSGQLFWVEGNSIKSCPTAGCPTGGPTTLVVTASMPAALAADANHVYFTFSDFENGALLRCPRTGCGTTPTTLASAQSFIGDIALSADAVYWVTGVGQLSSEVGEIRMLAK